MSDSGGGVKQFAGEMAQVVGEVAKDFSDQVGQAIETGAQSVVAPPLTPQQIQQQQQQDQNDLAEVRRKIAFHQQTDQSHKVVIQENKQKEQQRIHAQIQEQQAKKAEVSQMQSTKVPGGALSEEVARTRQEIGKGHGVGG